MSEGESEPRWGHWRCYVCTAVWMSLTARCPNCGEDFGRAQPAPPLPTSGELPVYGPSPLSRVPQALADVAAIEAALRSPNCVPLAERPRPGLLAAAHLLEADLARFTGPEPESLAVPRAPANWRPPTTPGEDATAALRELDRRLPRTEPERERLEAERARSVPRELRAARDFVADELAERFCRYEGDGDTGECALADASGCSACGLVQAVVSSRALELQRGAMSRLAQQVWKERRQHGPELLEDASFWMTTIELLLRRDDEFDVGPGLQLEPEPAPDLRAMDGSDVCADRIELAVEPSDLEPLCEAHASERRAARERTYRRAAHARIVRAYFERFAAPSWRGRLGRFARFLRGRP